jgi:sarcosine oxidase subunit beta
VKSRIIIIGGGVVGASVARHLSMRGGCEVVVLDRGKSIATGSTGRATGGARVQFGTETNILMSKYSIDFIRHWNRNCDYDPKGYLFFATSDIGLSSLERNLELQKSVGVTSTRRVTREEIGEICPLINTDDIVGGTFGQEDGFINPIQLAAGFRDEAIEHGTRFEYGVEVNSISMSGGRVSGVMTQNGELGCDAVVLCTGAHVAELGRTVGIDIPVTPQRRQIVWAKNESQLPESLSMVIDVESGFHFRPARDFSDPQSTAPHDQLLFAWPDPSDDSTSDEFDESFIPAVLSRSKQRLSIHDSLRIMPEKCRAGLYENTPDHHGIIGPAGPEGLFLACGFSGHGVMHSPATGRAMSEIIIDGNCSFMDISQLGFDRFKDGRLLEESSFI